MIHGVGAETPTQLLLFVTAGGVAKGLAGIAVVLLFVIGLILSNTLVTILTLIGFIHSKHSGNFRIALGVITAAFSLFVGLSFLFNQASLFSTLFGG